MANIPGMRSPQEQRINGGPSAAEVKGKVQDAASSVADTARDAASSVAGKARDVASGVGHKVSDAASAVGHKAEDAASSVGGGMMSLAGTIRGKLPHEGMAGSAGSAVADSLERGGRYLQEEGLSGIAEDLTNLVRRNPIPGLLIALGIGFLIARSTRS
jgi:hypothetical protein